MSHSIHIQQPNTVNMNLEIRKSQIRKEKCLPCFQWLLWKQEQSWQMGKSTGGHCELHGQYFWSRPGCWVCLAWTGIQVRLWTRPIFFYSILFFYELLKFKKMLSTSLQIYSEFEKTSLIWCSFDGPFVHTILCRKLLYQILFYKNFDKFY